MKTRSSSIIRKTVAAWLLITLIGVMLLAFTGCNEAEKVRENLAQESDNFNVARVVTVINGITNDTIFQIKGRISITADTGDDQLEILCEYRKGMYKKTIIGIPDNVTYVVDDLEATEVSEYGYEINFNPKMWLPVRPVIQD